MDLIDPKVKTGRFLLCNNFLDFYLLEITIVNLELKDKETMSAYKQFLEHMCLSTHSLIE